jgi:hypothetical protein
VASQPPGSPPELPQTALMVYGLVGAQALYVVAKLGIADLLVDGPKTSGELAEAAGAKSGPLGRVLRFLVSRGVFSQDSDGRYTLNENGQSLRSDVPRSVRNQAIFYGSPAVWQSWGNLLASVLTGETAFTVAHVSPLFEYLEMHPDDAAIFNVS